LYITSGGGDHTSWDRINTWNFANGFSFKFSAEGGDSEFSRLTNSDRIYKRSAWAWSEGGVESVVGFRSATQGVRMAGIVVDGLRVEDPLPTYPAFTIHIPLPSDTPPGEDTNITFTNIVIVNFSTVRRARDGTPLPHGFPNQLRGESPTVNISAVQFWNVTMARMALADVIYDPTVWNISGGRSVMNVTVDGQVVIAPPP
jgi:hypothetical protein